MPKIVDGQARRERIAEAVWAIAARNGLGSATIRTVAAECGLSVGSIQHSFASQACLQRFAMELIVQRVTERLSAPLASDQLSEAGVTDGIIALLLQLLPLDPEREAEARVWFAFLNAALTDDELAPYAAEIDALIGSFCRSCLEQLPTAREDEHASLEERATALHALLDGLTVHTLAAPFAMDGAGAERIVRSFLGQTR